MKSIKKAKSKIYVFLCLTIVSCIGLLFTNFIGSASALADESQSVVSLEAANKTSFWDKVAQNWIWIVVAVAVLLFLILFNVVLYVVCKHNKDKVIIKEKQTKVEMPVCKVDGQQPVGQPIQTTLVQPTKEEKSSVTDILLAQTLASKQQNAEKEEKTSISDILLAQALSSRQQEPFSWGNVLLNVKDDVKDVKRQMEYYEKAQADAKQAERFNELKNDFAEQLSKLNETLQKQTNTFQQKNFEREKEEAERAKQDLIAEKILDKLEELENTANETAQVVVEEKKTKNLVEDVSKPVEPEIVELDDEDLDDFSAEDFLKDEEQDGKLVSDDAVVIESAPKLTLKEAYEQLSNRQKNFFKKLEGYALSKPEAKEKETNSYLAIGHGNKNYARLAIKKNTVVAFFSLESEEMQRLRIIDGATVRPEKTKVKIIDDESLETAKKMIDIRVEQVAREIEIIKEARKEKQKLQYQKKKNS